MLALPRPETSIPPKADLRRFVICSDVHEDVREIYTMAKKRWGNLSALDKMRAQESDIDQDWYMNDVEVIFHAFFGRDLTWRLVDLVASFFLHLFFCYMSSIQPQSIILLPLLYISSLRRLSSFRSARTVHCF